jgi:hypothetical protein
MKTKYFKIQADPALALVVAEAMEKTGLGQSDILRRDSLRGVPEITSAMVAGTALTRLPEEELRRRVEALRFRTRLSPQEVEFDMFITSDQNIRYQQNLAGGTVSILELSTNDLRRVCACAAEVQAAVVSSKIGEFRRLDIP